MSQIHITTFYQFHRLSQEEVASLEQQLYEFATEHSIRGLVILGREGVNATLSSSPSGIERLKDFVRAESGFEETLFKDSTSDTEVFRRFKVKVRDEIVTLSRSDLYPEESVNHHLSAEEWNRVLQEEDDFVLIDTRNDYETRIGKFRKAIDPNIKVFSDFGRYIDDAQIPKEKKVLMYCTGGIRCEKAILEMQERGYENVYQLEGGILKYLEKYPHAEYEGECFVFDHRVAVDQSLKPSKKYHLCPHTGDPAWEKIECQVCGAEAFVASEGLSEAQSSSCSKNCVHHYERGVRLQGKESGVGMVSTSRLGFHRS